MVHKIRGTRAIIAQKIGGEVMVTLIRYIKLVLVLTSLLGMSSVANGSIVFQSKDWYLDISANTCTALTAFRRQPGEIYYFFVIVDKAGDHPTQFMVYPKDFVPSAQAYHLSLGTDRYYFSRLPKNNNGSEYSGHTFWNLPTNTPKLLNYIKQANQLHIWSTANNVELPFSLRGSTAAINELEGRCGSNSLLVSQDFESYLVPDSNKSVDILSLNDSETVEIRDIVAQAVVDYRAMLEVRNELQALEDRYSQWTHELAQLKNDINYLQNQRLPYLTQEKINAQNAIDTAKSEIPQYESLITNENINLGVAHKNYQAAYNKLAPHKPQHDQLKREFERAKNNLSQKNNELYSVQTRISQTNYDINRLQEKVDNLNWSIQQKRSQKQNEQNRLTAAQNKLNAFDPQTELQRRKQNNQNLQDVKAKIQQIKQNIQKQQIVVENAKQVRDNKKAQLDKCLSTGKPCEKKKQQLQEARQAFRSAKDVLEKKQANLAQKQQRRKNIVENIRQRVENDHQALRNEVNQLNQSVSILTQELQSLRQQRNYIVNTEIPTLENRLHSLNTELSYAETAVVNAQSRVNSARRAYNDFKVSVNYDYLKSEVDRTQSIVTNIQNKISSYEYEVSKRKQIIVDQTNYKQQMISEIQQTKNTIAQKKIRKDEVAELLKPYDIEKAEVVARLQLKLNDLAETKEAYVNSL